MSVHKTNGTGVGELGRIIDAKTYLTRCLVEAGLARSDANARGDYEGAEHYSGQAIAFQEALRAIEEEAQYAEEATPTTDED